MQLQPRRGRPRKFLAPSRAVTLTLPEEIIEILAGIDQDLSRAVVRLTQPKAARRPRPPADLTIFGKRAVILVSPTRTLERHAGVMLVPLPDGRALISFDHSTDVSKLELELQDAIEDDGLVEADRRVFEQVADILRSARRSPGVTLRQGNIIILEASRPSSLRSRPPGKTSRKRKQPLA